MELREALDQIAEIRERLAAAELFRGYRALPAAFSGLVAIAGGIVQPMLLPEPMNDPYAYVVLWSIVAAISLAAGVVGMWLLARMGEDSGAHDLTRTGLLPLAPCLAAGASVTLVLVRFESISIWMLPGLWQLFFSQGMFAACRTLPRPLLWIPCFYLVTGLGSLCLARGDFALTPLAVALPFGVGQIAAALALYWTLERHEQSEEIDAAG